MKWTFDDIPELSGKVVIVTGGNIGLGFQSSLRLARRGAHVVIATRKLSNGHAAEKRIRALIPKASLETIALDLLEGDNIRAFFDKFSANHNRLDILLNNAGVVNLENLRHTAEGHEMHMATNHYGHFALTSHLFPLLCQTQDARVVTVTSAAYSSGGLHFDDMGWHKRSYSRLRAYGDSKLANLLFTRALQNQFDRVGAQALSLSAHPGLTGTERQQTIGIGGKLAKFVASSVDKGVVPQLRAATDPSSEKCDFYAPKFGIRGPACKIKAKGDALDDALAIKLWRYTERVTSCSFT
ncbi:MAG: SDR family NAD(P)-dependent oxidoreductase [Parvibaculaceae bacterium]|nr:SDR family NAD(P)-dependent oxidoreductase [Parvibaculaceae bacterium]